LSIAARLAPGSEIVMPPAFVGVAVTVFAVFFIVALVTGRVPVTRTFFRHRYADRRDNPVLYWVFVFMLGLITLYGASVLAEGLLPGLDLPWVDG
jgi:hypothetical protein